MQRERERMCEVERDQEIKSKREREREREVFHKHCVNNVCFSKLHSLQFQDKV